MATVTEKEGLKVFTIRAADGSAEAQIVPEIGAAVNSLKLPWGNGLKETIFLHPFFWERESERTRGGFPFLFPICGRLERDKQTGTYLYDGRQYKMLNHGFSSRVPWKVEDSGKNDSLTLSLRDDKTSLALYPFHFELQLVFKVADGSFFIEHTFANKGATAMPYYAGFHPYFLTPPPDAGKEKVKLDYKPVEQWTYNERLTDVISRDAAPAMPAGICDPAINERLTAVGADKEARLVFPDGHTLHVCAEGVEDPDMFPFVQLYTMPDKPFFCIEHWMSYPNALNAVKGCRQLAPGRSERGIMKVWTT